MGKNDPEAIVAINDNLARQSRNSHKAVRLGFYLEILLPYSIPMVPLHVKIDLFVLQTKERYGK